MTGESPSTAVYLSDEEAKQFLYFRKNQDAITAFIGLVNIPTVRQIKIHRDDQGNIMQVDHFGIDYHA